MLAPPDRSLHHRQAPALGIYPAPTPRPRRKRPGPTSASRRLSVRHDAAGHHRHSNRCRGSGAAAIRHFRRSNSSVAARRRCPLVPGARDPASAGGTRASAPQPANARRADGGVRDLDAADVTTLELGRARDDPVAHGARSRLPLAAVDGAGSDRPVHAAAWRDGTMISPASCRDFGDDAVWFSCGGSSCWAIRAPSRRLSRGFATTCGIAAYRHRSCSTRSSWTAASRYRLDLAYPYHRICIEYDGREFHDGPLQQQADERRRAWLRQHGWTVIVVTVDDLKDRARPLAERDQRALWPPHDATQPTTNARFDEPRARYSTSHNALFNEGVSRRARRGGG